MTASYRAMSEEQKKELEMQKDTVREFFDREPNYIHFGWDNRDNLNKCARLTYLCFKTFFASVWFYFIPFACLYLSFAIPFHFTDSDVSEHAVDPLTVNTVEDDTVKTESGYDWDSLKEPILQATGHEQHTQPTQTPDINQSSVGPGGPEYQFDGDQY